MRRAHFYGHSGANGVTWSIMDVSRRLEERGHTVHIMCRTDSALTAYDNHTAYRYLHGLHQPFLKAALRRLLIRQQIDVLNAHSQRDAQTALAVAKTLGISTCYSCRELSELACDYAPQANRVIAVSAGVGDFLTERYGITAPVLHVIPNGIDFTTLPPDNRENYRTAMRFASDEVWVGFLGRIVKNKNVGGLMRAFAHAVTAAPRLRLAIIGSGPKEAAVRKLVVDLGVQDRIRFTGWLARDEAFRTVAALDALVLPSLGKEGLSNALLAAMAMRVPVLATDIPSLVGGPIRDGETGWICGTQDDALTDGLVRIAKCGSEQRLAIGAAARKEIQANYRMTRVINQLEDVYYSTQQPTARVMA